MERQCHGNTEQVPGHGVFDMGEVCFDSAFDNGNLHRVERGEAEDEFLLWTAQDNAGTEVESRHCSWFHFKISGSLTGKRITMVIMNSNKHAIMYKYDMRPVFRYDSTGSDWRRVASSVKVKDMSTHYQLRIEHTFAKDTAYFAFTYPYSYSACQADLAKLAARFDAGRGEVNRPETIYFHREVLTTSLDGRNIDLITVSDHNNILMDTVANYGGLAVRTGQSRAQQFVVKPYCFVSARVHPGEVPASHVHNGMLEFLLSNDTRAIAMRRKFVFIFVPMINPDGVYRGHFRMDQLGQNLNRHYLEPETAKQPSIYAIKAVVQSLSDQGRLQLYLDMHGHASKRGCFIYGNLLDELQDQVQNQLYCKLIGVNSKYFDYNSCLFSREHMTRIDPGDRGMSAEGSGRVATYLATGIIHSYTLECHYNCGRNASDKFTPAIYQEVGEACAVALLDLIQDNPASKLPSTTYHNLRTLYEEIISEIRARAEYRQRLASTSSQKQTASSKRTIINRKKQARRTRLVPNFDGFKARRLVAKLTRDGDNAPVLAESLNVARKGNERKKQIADPSCDGVRGSASLASATDVESVQILAPRRANIVPTELRSIVNNAARSAPSQLKASSETALRVEQPLCLTKVARRPSQGPVNGYSGKLRAYVRSMGMTQRDNCEDTPRTSKIAECMLAKTAQHFPHIYARNTARQQSASSFMDVGPKSARSAVCTHE